MKRQAWIVLLNLLLILAISIPVGAQSTVLGDTPPPLDSFSNTPVASAPPLFATVGSSRAVDGIVETDTDPDTMVLLLVTSQSTVTLPMQREGDGYWSSVITETHMVPPLVKYQLVAHYGTTTTISSPEYRLEVFSEIPSVSPVNTGVSHTVALKGAWGSGPTEFGLQSEEEGATAGPPSFAVDNNRNRIYVLDTINERVQVFDLAGQYQRSLALPSDSGSDIVIDPNSGTLYVLDQLQNTLYTLTPQVSAASPNLPSFDLALRSLDMRGEPFSTLLAYDTASNTVYRDQFAQGTYVPVSDATDVLSQNTQLPIERAGMPTAAGDVAVEVEGTSVVIGFGSDSRAAVQVNFAAEVMDVSDLAVGPDAMIWALVNLYLGEDSVQTLLLRFDPALRQAQVAKVTSTTIQDVTRRLVAVEQGVLLLESDAQELRLVRLQLSNENAPSVAHIYLPVIQNATTVAQNDLERTEQSMPPVLVDDAEIEEAATDSVMLMQYNPNWTRKQAKDYAESFLGVKYDWGGGSSDRGFDCSGYVAKAWAIPYYTDRVTDSHPYDTKAFYEGGPYWKRVDRYHPTPLSAWVYRSEAGGRGNHTGLFIRRISKGGWLVYEASPKSGIIQNRRNLGDLIGRNYHRIERKNWGNKFVSSQCITRGPVNGDYVDVCVRIANGNSVRGYGAMKAYGPNSNRIKLTITSLSIRNYKPVNGPEAGRLNGGSRTGSNYIRNWTTSGFTWNCDYGYKAVMSYQIIWSNGKVTEGTNLFTPTGSTRWNGCWR